MTPRSGENAAHGWNTDRDIDKLVSNHSNEMIPDEDSD